jgi:hypothetical protein
MSWTKLTNDFFNNRFVKFAIPIDYFTDFLEGIVPHTGQTNASRYVFAKLVSEFKKVLKMGQHSIKIKRGEVMCGRKGLLAIGERGTALNLDLINEKCLRLFCLKA